MLSNLTLKLEKLEWVTKLPWVGIGVLLSISFTIATLISILVGYQITPEYKKGASSNVPVTTAVRTAKNESLTPLQVRNIVERNLFNSEGKTPEDDEKRINPKVNNGSGIPKSSLPLIVRGIIYGSKENSGLAVIEMKSKSVNSFMVGDTIMPNVILDMILEDKVVISNAGNKEYLKLERVEIVQNKRARKKSKPRSTERTTLAPIANEPPPENYSEDGFERAGGKIAMTQEYKKRMLTSGLAQILQDAKAEPHLVGTELRGFKLTRIRENSIYQKSGLQNGDVITEINGNALNDTGRAIRLLNQLRNESHIEIRFERDGNPQNVVIEVGT